jgi:hypothetical protein
MVNVLCKHCKKEFYAKPSWLKKGWGVYCSNECRYEGGRLGQVISCFGCGKEAYKQPKALTRSKSGNYFCGKSCQTKWRNKIFAKDKHPNWKGGKASYRSLMLKQQDEPKCTLCKTIDERILAVHHIDENRSNNVIENLAWLCHNCHHLVHHYPDERAKFMAVIV